MYILIRVISYFLIVTEFLKGRKTITEIKYPINEKEYLEVNFNNCQLKIYCHKKQFRRSYDYWLIPNGHHSVYSVFSVITDSAPDELKKACQLKLDIPALLPEVVEDEYQRLTVMHAYLDILIEELDRNKFKK